MHRHGQHRHAQRRSLPLPRPPQDDEDILHLRLPDHHTSLPTRLLLHFPDHHNARPTRIPHSHHPQPSHRAPAHDCRHHHHPTCRHSRPPARRPVQRHPNREMDRFLLESRTGVRPPPKTIFLVRHGESTHNAHSLKHLGADLNDMRYLDAPLTPRGESQALEIAPTVRALRPELLVTSPLTRATQTCLLATSRLSRAEPLVVHPLCVERLAYACDIGSPVTELERRFPGLDYGWVRPRDGWWWMPRTRGDVPQMESLWSLWNYPPGRCKDAEPKEVFRKRVDDFRIWLLQRPEKRIAVFAHGIFLTALMASDRGFHNAEIREWLL